MLKTKKFRVWYEQTNTHDIEVEAKDKEEAREKADEIINSSTFEDNVNASQKGYFEHTYTDVEEDE